jgi:hypothetical protein
MVFLTPQSRGSDRSLPVEIETNQYDVLFPTLTLQPTAGICHPRLAGTKGHLRFAAR